MIHTLLFQQGQQLIELCRILGQEKILFSKSRSQLHGYEMRMYHNDIFRILLYKTQGRMDPVQIFIVMRYRFNKSIHDKTAANGQDGQNGDGSSIPYAYSHRLPLRIDVGKDQDDDGDNR